jgi:hypothetical protein
MAQDSSLLTYPMDCAVGVRVVESTNGKHRCEVKMIAVMRNDMLPVRWGMESGSKVDECLI